MRERIHASVEWATIRMMMRERFGWVKQQCREAEIFESVFAGRWTDERIYDLVADPLADFVYQGVGTVWELGNTILLLVSGQDGILVQVHAAHSVSAINYQRETHQHLMPFQDDSNRCGKSSTRDVYNISDIFKL